MAMDVLLDFFLKGLGLTRETQRVIMRATWYGFISFYVGWALGFWAFLGLQAPYARASNVEQIAADLHRDRVEAYAQRILNTRVSQCNAKTPEARQQYTERLNELIQRYVDIENKEPRVPRCDEV